MARQQCEAMAGAQGHERRCTSTEIHFADRAGHRLCGHHYCHPAILWDEAPVEARRAAKAEAAAVKAAALEAAARAAVEAEARRVAQMEAEAAAAKAAAKAAAADEAAALRREAKREADRASNLRERLAAAEFLQDHGRRWTGDERHAWILAAQGQRREDAAAQRRARDDARRQAGLERRSAKAAAREARARADREERARRQDAERARAGEPRMKRQTRRSVSVRGITATRAEAYCAAVGIAVAAYVEGLLSADLDARGVPVPAEPRVIRYYPRPPRVAAPNSVEVAP